MAFACSRVGEAEVETLGVISFGEVLMGAALMSLATGLGLASWASVM